MTNIPLLILSFKLLFGGFSLLTLVMFSIRFICLEDEGQRNA